MRLNKTGRGRILRTALLVPVVAILLSACATSNRLDPERATAVNVASTLAAPSVSDQLAMTSRAAVVGPGDKLDFKVLGVPELDRSLRVGPDGVVAFPLIGAVMTAGVPLGELRETVTRRLRERYLQDPNVSIELTESVSRRFVIDGGVRTPGIYQVVGDATLTQVVAQAQGLTDTATAREVIVFRTLNGQRYAAQFDLAAINSGQAEDPAIYPNDRVIVGNNRNRALIRELISLTPLAGVFYQVLN